MKLLEVTKDGGPESTVWAHWLIEMKGLFSIVLLRFEDGSRDAYHSHSFNSVSWVLRGKLFEIIPYLDPSMARLLVHAPSWKPVITRRTTTHKVVSRGRTWVISFRGPWSNTWKEVLPNGETVTLTHGRKLI
jgi:hypothetical protein